MARATETSWRAVVTYHESAYPVRPWSHQRSGSMIRIRIRGSVPLEYGSGFCYFLQWLSRCQRKIRVSYAQFFFAYYSIYSRYIYISLQRYQIIQKFTKMLKSRFFLGFLLLVGRNRILIRRNIKDPNSGGPKNYAWDPDPKKWAYLARP